MPRPLLSASPIAPADLEVDVLIIGIAPRHIAESSPSPADAPAVQFVGIGLDLGPFLSSEGMLSALGLTGATDETARVPAPAGVRASSLLLVGLGRAELSAESLRSAAGTAARAVGTASRLGIALPTSSPADVQAVLEGAAMGSYRYSARVSSEAPSGSGSIIATTQIAETTLCAAKATVTADAVALIRDLVNAPPNELYPETFVERAREAIGDLPIEIEEWGVKELEAGGFGGILGVGQGSARPPRLLALRYRRAADAPHLALVGKGITFDSGGLSLKPAASMVGMKYDMTGAATALAAVISCARLGLDTRVTAWLCLAENMPSSMALRPNDVLTIRGGTTVEVLNTDAEGRLVLADGLVAASEERPDAIVDVATLTGAARVALGERYVGLMGDASLVDQIKTAANETGELVWPMPLPGELRALLKSDVADIANVKPGSPAAGMLIAGVFLREFVGRTNESPDAPRIPWAHLDIAGVANNAGPPFGYTPKGPSGVTVRLLVRLAETLSAKE